MSILDRNKDISNYLNNKPTTIYWYVVAGNRRLSVLEDHDLIFDQKDMDMRFPARNRKYRV